MKFADVTDVAQIPARQRGAYQRWVKHYKDTFPERFWARVKIGSADECWPWTGLRVSTDGYGMVSVPSDKVVGAHRVAWMLHNHDDIPSGMFICHRCDNKPCCNPAHLFVGTPLDNVRDMIQKGKKPSVKGIQPSNTILTKEQVTAIRLAYHPEKHTARRIGQEYGVSKACVIDVLLGRNWKHLPLTKALYYLENKSQAT